MSSHELQPVVPRRSGLVAVDGRTYPLESVRLAGRAEGGVAFSTLTQRYANPYDEPLEVIYTLPLPSDGAVLGYTIRMADRVIRGEIQPRDQAERAYRDALYEGRTAGLLDQDRSDVFRQRLGNLPPRTAVEVAIDVLQPLAFLAAIEGGAPQWEYRFPTVVGVRYEGAPGRVPDAERLTADRDADGGIPTRIELSLEIADPTDAPVASPSHELVLERNLETRLVRLGEDRRLDRDIVLRWEACRQDVGVRVVEGRGLPGDEGRYALVTVVPPRVPQAALHRDLTVLVDASGSMSGLPLEHAKHVVDDLLASLEPEDRFELFAFASDVRRLTPGLVGASEKTIAAARNNLRELQAGGATEMLDAVERALAPLRRDAQRQIVLVSDGQIGFERDVIARVAGESRSGVRVHTVGIGSAPNRTLLRGLAMAGRGIELSVSDEHDASDVARRLRAATVRPVLTDLSIAGAALRDVAPERPRDVCAGQPLVLAVELAPDGGDLVVSGRVPGTSNAWTSRIAVPSADSSEPRDSTPMPIGALFGRAAIDDLEVNASFRSSGASIDEAVRACALRHGIVSRVTSLVAFAEEPSVDPRAPRRREKLALEMPRDVSAEGLGMFRMAYASAAMLDQIEYRQEDGEQMRSPRLSQHLRTLMMGPKAKQALLRQLHGEMLLEATVIRRDGDLLVIEIQMPFAGLVHPTGEVTVLRDGSPMGNAVFVPELSAPADSARKGTLVRLALRIQGQPSWPEGGTLALMWQAREKTWGRTKPRPIGAFLELDPASVSPAP